MWQTTAVLINAIAKIVRRLWTIVIARYICAITCGWHRPVFTPAYWNDGGFVQSHNNCYNYGTNQRNNTFAQPGYASGIPGEWSPTCAGVTSRAVADGLISQTCGSPCTGNCCEPVSLVVWPGVDYHWYRQDTNGMWSHKPGGTPAHNTDDSGNLIGDPLLANRGPYTEYCGCFCRCTCRVKSVRGIYPPS
jgi:hypothetical protein